MRPVLAVSSSPERGLADAALPGLSGMSDAELEAWLVGHGEPAYRAR